MSVTPLPREPQDLRFRPEILADFLAFAWLFAGCPAFLMADFFVTPRRVTSFFAPLLLGDCAAGNIAWTTDACAAG
jgi:hypothetical protein